MLSRSSALAAALLLAQGANAFWRLPCNNVLVAERGDSIVSPGAVSGHTHSILGGSNFAFSTSFGKLRESTCTSCLVKQDMSNYWTPQLYFQWANGSFSSVDPIGGGLIYYLPRNHSSDTTKVQAFPDGLKMLIGNPFKRSYNASSDADQAIGWNCLGGPVPTGTDTRQPYLPPYNCPDNLRGELRFPSCWNGKDLDSSDHFSHMAYPIGGETGPCPTGYPVRLVTLFYEISWAVQDFAAYRSQGLNATQPFVLAMGDATGYGFHGDFFNGWDRTVLQTAIDTCTSESGVIEYCEVFDLYSYDHECHQTSQVDEVVLGLVPSLPGCNPVTGFGPNATPCTASTTPALIDNVAYEGAAPPAGAKVPANEPSVVMEWTSPSTSHVFNYVDCYSDAAGGVRALPNGLTPVNKTVDGCLDACDKKGYLYCGVEYHGECWGANTLAASSTAQGSAACALTCTDNPLQYCGGTGGSTAATMELYQRSSVTANKKLLSDAFSYVGCYADLVKGVRTLSKHLTTSTWTVSSCAAAAKSAGYNYAGVEYGGEWASATLSNTSTILPAASCSMNCNDDSRTTCGGTDALDIYKLTTTSTTTTATTIKTRRGLPARLIMEEAL